MEQDRVELSTPALSERCSNQLSYCSKSQLKKIYIKNQLKKKRPEKLSHKNFTATVCTHTLPGNFRFPIFPSVLQKEVIQPHFPVRLPCYDFTPLTKHTLGSGPLAVSLPTLGILDSDGVTGGVYKARERIHRAVLMRDY